jgi:cytidylate kinase
LDTGLLYRAVGKKALAYKVTSYYPEVAVQHAKSLTPEDLQADDLRTARVAQAASKVAVIPEVRAVLLDFQRDFAKRDGGAVLDGRDIGTVICPNADVKLFVTASAEVRANRRVLELSAKGDTTDYETVLADVIARDERDATRDTAPMIAAKGSVLIDTSDMTIEDAVAHAIALIAQKMPAA